MINYEIRDSQVQFESLPHSIEMFIYDRIYFTNLMLWRLDAGLLTTTFLTVIFSITVK